LAVPSGERIQDMLRRISMTPEDIIRGLRDVLPGAGLCARIDDRAAGSRFHTREHIVLHERLAIDEADLVGATVELPQIAVAPRRRGL